MAEDLHSMSPDDLLDSIQEEAGEVDEADEAMRFYQSYPGLYAKYKARFDYSTERLARLRAEVKRRIESEVG